MAKKFESYKNRTQESWCCFVINFKINDLRNFYYISSRQYILMQIKTYSFINKTLNQFIIKISWINMFQLNTKILKNILKNLRCI